MDAAHTLWIEGPAGRLEAVVRAADAPRGSVAIAHPHPLYGGTLHNPVVFHVDRALNRAGLTTLRFNFRGVNGSEGVHDDGRGEVGDVAAASAWVRALAPGRPTILVGYSFGARCCISHAIEDATVDAVVAIGLPVCVYDFGDLPALHRPLAVVQGTEDEFGSIDEVENLLRGLSPRGRLYEVPGATHLFAGSAPEAGARVVEAVDEILRSLGASRRDS